MKKYLITGIGGFVGRYFWEYLLEHEQSFCVLGLDIMTEAPWEHPALRYRHLNLMDEEAVREAIFAFQPDCIVHLAAVSSVALSWKAPADCLANNMMAFLNVAEAARTKCPAARILSVGSSEEYGNHPPEAMPLCEKSELKPASPYALARACQERISRFYAESYGMNIMMTRSFNHTGPRQRDTFVIPSFVKQLVEIRKNKGSGVLRTGNLDVVRDFLDVRDVVDAYWRILDQGKPGEVYNVCSGKGVSLRDVITMAADMLGVTPVVEPDPARIRPVDNAVIIGDCSRLRESLNWTPRFSLERTVEDMVLHFLEIYNEK